MDNIVVLSQLKNVKKLHQRIFNVFIAATGILALQDITGYLNGSELEVTNTLLCLSLLIWRMIYSRSISNILGFFYHIKWARHLCSLYKVATARLKNDVWSNQLPVTTMFARSRLPRSLLNAHCAAPGVWFAWGAEILGWDGWVLLIVGFGGE